MHKNFGNFFMRSIMRGSNHLYSEREVRYTIQWSISPIAGILYDSIPEHFALTKPATQPPVVVQTIQGEYT